MTGAKRIDVSERLDALYYSQRRQSYLRASVMHVPLTLRMVAPVVGVSLMLLGVGFVTAWYVEHMQQEAARVLAQNVASIRAAQGLEIGLRKFRSRINTFRLTADSTYLADLPDLRRETDDWLAETDRLGATEREKSLMAGVREHYDRFFENCDRLVERVTIDDTQEAFWTSMVDELQRRVFDPTHDYVDINAKLIAQSSEQSEWMARRMVFALILLATTGPVAGLLAGFGIARAVARSIVQLSVPIQDAAGKLRQVVGPITVSTAIGFDDLERELRGIAEKVGAVVEQLEQSQREVLRSEQLAAVGQLAAGVAHELRNPLMSIKLLVQNATRRGELASLEGRDLEVLLSVISRLEASLQSLLDFARPRLPQKHRFDLIPIVHETIALVAGRAARQSVAMHSVVAPSPVILHADPEHMRQLVLNLLLNALDAVSMGDTVSLTVHAPASQGHSIGLPCHHNGDCVTIEVCDTGPGLPADLGERIFEPFVSSKDTGTGLGLTISKRIVEAHGGSIAAGNRPHGGARFTVRIPLDAPAAAQIENAPCPHS